MNVLRRIDELEQLVEDSKRLMGKVFVDEAKYQVALQNLRESLAAIGIDSSNQNVVIQHVDKIEGLLSSSSGFMGKRGFSEEEFFATIQQLRSILPRVMFENEAKAKSQASTQPRAELTANANPSINRQIGFEELLRDGARVFDEVEKGESFFVVREGRIVAQLIPFR